jgi:hypothetical protein
MLQAALMRSITIVALAGVVAACAGCENATVNAPAPRSQEASTTRPAVIEALSADAIEYARELGGTSHNGEPVYLVLASTHDRQSEASAALAATLPSFGDAQAYFTVQRSDSFDDLESGRWVVAEAYWTRSEAGSGLAWATGRGGEDATLTPTLESVTVRSDDPIPVVEDVMFDEGLSVEPARGPLVKVPDVLGAIRDHRMSADYATDPEAVADEIRAVAREAMLKAGLLSSLEFRSIALKDQQSPRPGTMVPKGTIVRTRIGIGD